MNRATKETGACFGGPDSGRWPAIWHDVVTHLNHQAALEMNARNPL